MVGPVGGQYTSAVNTMNRFGDNINIPEMGLLIQMERHNVIQDQVKDQFKDMQARNEWLKAANEALNTMRTNRQQDPNGEGVRLSLLKGPPGYANMEDYYKQNGIEYPPRPQSQKDMDTCIENLKSSIDSANTNSQLDMVRMQGLMDKMNQATEFMTSWISKNDKTMDSIIGNIR